MKDKNDWLTQGIKISCKHKKSLYAFTTNSNDPEAKCIILNKCKILRKVLEEATIQ